MKKVTSVCLAPVSLPLIILYNNLESKLPSKEVSLPSDTALTFKLLSGVQWLTKLGLSSHGAMYTNPSIYLIQEWVANSYMAKINFIWTCVLFKAKEHLWFENNAGLCDGSFKLDTLNGISNSWYQSIWVDTWEDSDQTELYLKLTDRPGFVHKTQKMQP